MLVMFFFFLFFRHAFSELPRPIALKLCHIVGICVYFIMQVQKLGGHSPKKIWGPKTCKISVDFTQPPTLISNISGTAQDIQLDGQGKARREAARRRNSECKINLSCRNSSRGNGSRPTAQR